MTAVHGARSLAVILHRWAGLLTAVFLAGAGLTGSLLAWDKPLDRALWPVLAPVPAAGRQALDAIELRGRALATIPGLAVDPSSAQSPQSPQSLQSLQSAQSAQSPPSPQSPPRPDAEPLLPVRFVLANSAWKQRTGFDEEVYLDPYSGHELGRRRWGDLGEGRTNVMPFVHRLHRSLALGPIGSRLLGGVALLWTLDCFVGFYLTLPKGRPLLTKWRPAFGVQAKRLNLDLHRAGGLWLWALLLVFAWSSVGFDLPQVYLPVMKLFAGLSLLAVDGLPNRPSASSSVGDWLAGFHTARLGGLPLQLLVCASGLAVAGLSFTGCVVWWRKRRGRIVAARLAAQRRAGLAAAATRLPHQPAGAATAGRDEHRRTDPASPALARRPRRDNRPTADSLLPPPWPTRTPKTATSPPRNAS